MPVYPTKEQLSDPLWFPQRPKGFILGQMIGRGPSKFFPELATPDPWEDATAVIARDAKVSLLAGLAVGISKNWFLRTGGVIPRNMPVWKGPGWIQAMTIMKRSVIFFTSTGVAWAVGSTYARDTRKVVDSWNGIWGALAASVAITFNVRKPSVGFMSFLAISSMSYLIDVIRFDSMPRFTPKTKLHAEFKLPEGPWREDSPHNHLFKYKEKLNPAE